jgi:hypothetical protein
MADVPFGGPAPVQDARDGRASAVKTLGTVTNWTGAAVSLALIVGIGVWSYKTLARDVSGVPVVRAASGEPMRIQPDDPGGSPALHQGLAVNSVAAAGVAEKPADRLILAPAPVSLSDEDLPSGDVTVAASPELQAPAAITMAPETPQMASIRALADKLSSGSSPLAEVDAAPAVPRETVQPAAAVVPAEPVKPVADKAAPKKAVVKGGIKRSLRPVLRPASLRKTAAAGPLAAAVAAAEVDPASVPAGTRLTQLGAFDSAETARSEWDKLNLKFADYLEGKQRVIQKAKSGGRVFYRLRAMGFADLSDARRFCSALVAEKADCIPVTTK